MKPGVLRGAPPAPAPALALIGAILLAACGTDSSSAAGPQPLQVVAAENFWGSVASQLGGDRVTVTSIVTDPNADPHEYESSPADARLFARASYVIQNGAGYDSWADQLLAAQPEPGRRVLTVATLLGKHDGDNPHFWYGPSYVFRVIDRITEDYEAIDPGHAGYFASRHGDFERQLDAYRGRLGYIQRHFGGRPVAATESIFQYMAQYLRLDLVTPYAFMKAVAEGDDPPASSEVTFIQQIHERAFNVLVYNLQTVTPLTTSIREQTATQDIPVIGVSETVQPPIATFQEWMDGELDSLINALNARALGQ